MDRLHALRDTANLPRAVAPPPLRPDSSSGMEQGLNDSGLDMRMDDSLTDIQWLQKMDASSEIPGFAQKQTRKRLPKSGKENHNSQQKLSKDGCRKRLSYDSATTTRERGEREGEKTASNKPPLSYASLIVLAISSTPQRMLTLSGIYRWIESTFPFYRTPESKAWKNSIRHNLSIRKNMFTKVYQYPPRRGNGSYWTLLSDGEEELTKAHPLFTTLLPPIIDAESVYCRTPLTHTVKSRGQYVPVLPQSSRVTPYFAGSATQLGHHGNEDNPVITGSSALGMSRETAAVSTATKKRKRKCSFDESGDMSSSSVTSTPKHLREHSYSKTVTFEPEIQLVEEELAPEDVVEESFVLHSIPGMESERAECDSTTDVCRDTCDDAPRQCATPTNPDHTHFDHAQFDTSQESMADCSLSSLLGSSFLTPTKMAAMSEINPDLISFSPLYNFVTPHRGGVSPHPRATMSSSTSNCAHHIHNETTPTAKRCHGGNVIAPPTYTACTVGPPTLVPISHCSTTPSHSHSDMGTGISELDSGVFSPFPSSLRFSTPLGLKTISPLVDLPGNVFNTPQSSERVSVAERGISHGEVSGVTPCRKPGSRQLFPFPGSTPPS